MPKLEPVGEPKASPLRKQAIRPTDWPKIMAGAAMSANSQNEMRCMRVYTAAAINPPTSAPWMERPPVPYRENLSQVRSIIIPLEEINFPKSCADNRSKKDIDDHIGHMFLINGTLGQKIRHTRCKQDSYGNHQTVCADRVFADIK